MNKAQLIESLADRLGGKKAATEAVNAVLETIQRTVKDGVPVALSGFGVFEKVTVPARRHRNPRTGEPVKTKKTTRPKFRPGQGFKDVVNGTRKLPKVTAAATATPTKSTVTAKRTAGTTTDRTAANKTASAGSVSTRAKKAPTATKAPATKAAGAASTARSAANKTTANKTTGKRSVGSAQKTTAAKSTAAKSTARTAKRAPSAAKRSAAAKRT